MTQSTTADYDRTDYSQDDAVELHVSLDDPRGRTPDRYWTGTVTSTGALSGVLTVTVDANLTVKIYDDGSADVVRHNTGSRDFATLENIKHGNGSDV